MSEKTYVRNDRRDPIMFDVDLKWSLWSQDEGVWEEYAPETIKHLRAGIDEGYMEEYGEGVVVNVAPRKEIRYGTVYVRYDAEKDAIVANVHFMCNWDSVEVLASYLENMPEPAPEWFEDVLPKLDCGDVGVELYREFTVDSLHDLLVKTDAVENDLLNEDSREWQRVKAEVEWYRAEYGDF